MDIRLCAFDMNCIGHQSCGLWRHPRDRSRDYTRLTYWTDLAQTLERGLFDAVFLADVTGVYDVYGGSPDAALRNAMQVPANDPFTLIPAMAVVTNDLCFGVTGTISYEPPFAFARRVSSLDHLTDGRMGWNIVTGYLDSAARGVGKQHQADHDIRYQVAEEYMEIVYRLWEESWGDGAVLADKTAGEFANPEKVHSIRHEGEFFELDAIHLCEPSPQRTPVLFQAGASQKGQNFAARHAECVFVGGTDPLLQGRSVSSLRKLIKQSGRSSSDVKVFALASIVTGRSDSEAQDKLADYSEYVSMEAALALASGWTGVDLSAYAPGDTIGDVQSNAIQSALKAARSTSVGEWAAALGVGGGGPTFVGAPDSVAEQMERWVNQTGVDGFNLSYTVVPECVTDVVDLVVPELQERGLYKTSYAEGTFRSKLFGGPHLTSPHPGAGLRS